MKRPIATALFLVSLVLLSGCEAQKTHAIRGTVTRGGEKLSWPNDGRLLVIFVPENRTKNKDVYSAETDITSSTYTIAAIPAGRYQVAIQQFDLKWKDALKDEYDLGTSKLYFEVTGDDQVIDIDIPPR